MVTGKFFRGLDEGRENGEERGECSIGKLVELDVRSSFEFHRV